MAPKDRVVLAPLDMDKVRREDAKMQSSAEKDPVRIGVYRALPSTLHMDAGIPTLGAWKSLPDGGRLWHVEVLSPGALGIRFELTAMHLPEDGYAMLYPPGAPEFAVGPFHEIPEGEDALWAPTCFGESVVLECYLPPGKSAKSCGFVVKRVAHIYQSIADLLAIGLAGACNLDVTCYPAWADTALGVGGLGTIAQSGVLFCTCTLLADEDDCTDVPYVITANHCVRGQTGTRGASSLEFYWQFQTDTCNGAPPSPATVPRTTGGADYLDGADGTGYSGGGNDFTFMRMRELPPPLPKVSWATAPPALGTEVTCLHHPRGEFKRISFGTLTDNGNTHDDLYHQVLWDDGTTEPGSSGSPLFVTATQELIGQLWGGTASCFAPLEPDYYGRFDVTYGVVGDYLQPPVVALEQAEATVEEGDGQVVFTVLVTAPYTHEGVTVYYTAAGGTAVAGEDFSLGSGSLDIDPGVTEAPISIAVTQDVRLEDTETFILELSANCATVDAEKATAMASILDDDIDSDGDGLSDGEEVQGFYGFTSDPTKTDTDQDGLSDYHEALGTLGYVTDPNLRDTDEDGLSDYLEYVYNLNPLNGMDGHPLSSLTLPWFQPAVPFLSL